MKQLEEQCYYIVFNISANKHLDKIFIARQEAEEYAQTFIYKDDKYKIIPLVLLSDAEQILKTALEEINAKIEKIAELHPYKQQGNKESYSQYNEGWTDACGAIQSQLKGR